MRIESEPSAVKEWGPNHWIVREFPICVNILSSKHSASNIERLLEGEKNRTNQQINNNTY